MFDIYEKGQMASRPSRSYSGLLSEAVDKYRAFVDKVGQGQHFQFDSVINLSKVDSDFKCKN